jgi:hypothetical protein
MPSFGSVQTLTKKNFLEGETPKETKAFWQMPGLIPRPEGTRRVIG